jgi:hypothetical protein
MNFIKNPTVIIVVLGLIVGSGLYFYNSYQNSKKAAEEQKATETAATTEETITNLTNADPADFTAENKKELDLADTKAKAYNSLETLSAVEITIPGKLVPRSGTATYIYDQAGDAKNHFIISISQSTQTFIRGLVPREDYMGNLTAINLKSWKLSYIEALKVAEKNGGQEFRSSNTLSQLRMTLKNSNPKGWLYWIIDYEAEGGKFSAQIDAYSGRFVPESEISNSNSTDSTASTTQTNP